MSFQLLIVLFEAFVVLNSVLGNFREGVLLLLEIIHSLLQYLILLLISILSLFPLQTRFTGGLVVLCSFFKIPE